MKYCDAIAEGPCPGWTERPWPWHGCCKKRTHTHGRRPGSPEAIHECRCGKTWHGTVVYRSPLP